MRGVRPSIAGCGDRAIGKVIVTLEGPTSPEAPGAPGARDRPRHVREEVGAAVTSTSPGDPF